MTPYFKIILCAFLLSAMPASAQETPPPVKPVATAPAPALTADFIRYAHNNSEYSVMLPEAPHTETIWGDLNEGQIPYLDNPPRSGNLGEIATYRRVDLDTDDIFDVKITFLKADQDFLTSLTDERIQELLDKNYKLSALNDRKYNFSTGTNTKLKWVTVSGFSIDKANQAFFEAEHFLTGTQSILSIRVKYSVQNEKFGEYYKQMIDSIKYHPL